MTTLRTPDEMFEQAKEVMLDGRDPASKEEWALIVNCWAVNVYPSVAYDAIDLLRVLYDVPLSREECSAIVKFQLSRPDPN